MITEYNRNILIKQRQEELERKEKASSSSETPIVNDTKTAAESAVAETVENTAEKQEQPVKKTEAEKLSRKKKQG